MIPSWTLPADLFDKCNIKSDMAALIRAAEDHAAEDHAVFSPRQINIDTSFGVSIL